MITIQKIVIIFFMLLLFSCRHEANKIPSSIVRNVKKSSSKANIDDSTKINDSVYVIKKQNTESLFCMFYSKNRKNIVSFDSIIVENKFNKKTQKIKFKKDYFISSWQADFSVNEDINFDGFNDIRIINYNGEYNSSYSFWLYKNRDHNYIHAYALDSIYNPIFDHKKKEIYSEWRVAFDEYHFEKYFWKNNNLILKEKHIQYSSNNEDSSANSRIPSHRNK